MTENELLHYLKRMYPRETENCEWKECSSLRSAVSARSGEDIISYICGIANSGGGHLVLGVADGLTHIVGIQDFGDYTLENIRVRIGGNCTNLDLEHLHVEPFTCGDSHKAVWVFHIPTHKFRTPVVAHKKAWQRIGDSLQPMTEERREAIINTPTPIGDDWTAQLVGEATLDDLDADAVAVARERFKKLNHHDDGWDTAKFLSKVGLMKNGELTRAAILLLGNPQAQRLIGYNYQIRWNLRTVSGMDKDYEIFTIPYILAVEKVYAKIRNLNHRFLSEGTLFIEGMLRYDPFVIREPLNNAIAHQDYTQHAMINVTEVEDERLVYANAGRFLPESVRDVVLRDEPEQFYRNPLLVDVMRNFGMVDKQGGGIRKIFNFQRERRFPAPEYDLNKGKKVVVTITGKVLNEEFAKILAANPELTIEDVFLLDMVQKGKPLTPEGLKYLRKKGFIEGRGTSIYLSHKIVSATKDETLRAEHVRNRSFDDRYFLKMILEYLKSYGEATRKQLDILLIDKLSDILSDEAKENKVTNLIQTLRKSGYICTGEGKMWVIAPTISKQDLDDF